MTTPTERTPFQEWHYTHGNNTQGIKWVDELVEAAWQASRKAALDSAAEVCETHAHGWEKNPGNNPHAGFIAASNCANDIRSMK